MGSTSRVKVECWRVCWRLDVGTFDSSLLDDVQCSILTERIRWLRNASVYDACHQVKQNARMRETIARTISPGKKGLILIHLGVEKDCLPCAKTGNDES